MTNSIDKLEKDIRQYDDYFSRLFKKVWDDGKKQEQKRIVEIVKEAKAPIELMQDGQSLDYSFRKGYNQAISDIINKIEQ